MHFCHLHWLDDDHAIGAGFIPDHLHLTGEQFDKLWTMHPTQHHLVRTPTGKWCPIPRWQAAYGADYKFSGNVVQASPTPPELQPILVWARAEIDPRLNGTLMNWYEGPGHYIGPHHDTDRDLHVGSPIVTISYGETRTFRMRPAAGRGFRDFKAVANGFLVVPYRTNRRWKHEVVKSVKNTGRRISVTLRAFTRGVVDA